MEGYTGFSNAIYETWAKGCELIGSLISQTNGGDLPDKFKGVHIEKYDVEAILIRGYRTGSYQAILRCPTVIVHGEVSKDEKLAVMSLEEVIARIEKVAGLLPKRKHE